MFELLLRTLHTSQVPLSIVSLCIVHIIYVPVWPTGAYSMCCVCGLVWSGVIRLFASQLSRSSAGLVVWQKDIYVAVAELSPYTLGCESHRVYQLLQLLQPGRLSCLSCTLLSWWGCHPTKGKCLCLTRHLFLCVNHLSLRQSPEQSKSWKRCQLPHTHVELYLYRREVAEPNWLDSNSHPQCSGQTLYQPVSCQSDPAGWGRQVQYNRTYLTL